MWQILFYGRSVTFVEDVRLSEENILEVCKNLNIQISNLQITYIESTNDDKPLHRPPRPIEDEMRYFIYYPPTKSIRQIDVTDTVRVQDIIKQVQHEFHLTAQGSGPSETSIVLNYNGSDLKPKWAVGDLGIPSGAIIRCLYREQKAADLYIYCAFNQQTIKIFDSTLTLETTIGTIRKKLSDTLGLPLSTFCLESRDGRVRYYDHMKLISYDIKLNGRVYLKVWKGFEKFLTNCLKGFHDTYAQDDLTRQYQLQIALHIAAFYGHMELATSAMQMGARSDRPVGEHPSRQWSSVLTDKILPEIQKCPFHIAIERAHVKIVDLFVRHNILCTQVRHPINDYLPYRLALTLSSQSKVKDERQRYSEIYFYLDDKQFNLRIPLNSNGEHVQAALGSSTSVSVVTHHSQHHVLISLPLYCKIIKWYERARESAWKKNGGNFYSNPLSKRIYPKTGLLGYKVLIDGYNNTFDGVQEQYLQQKPNSAKHSGGIDYIDRYFGKDIYEKEKYLQKKTYMKQFGVEDKHRKGNLAPTITDQRRFATSKRQMPYTSKIDQDKTSKVNTNKSTVVQPPLEGLSSSSEFLQQQSRDWQVMSNQKLTLLPATINESAIQLSNALKHLATRKSAKKVNTNNKDTDEKASTVVSSVTTDPSTITHLTTSTVTQGQATKGKEDTTHREPYRKPATTMSVYSTIKPGASEGKKRHSLSTIRQPPPDPFKHLLSTFPVITDHKPPSLSPTSSISHKIQAVVQTNSDIDTQQPLLDDEPTRLMSAANAYTLAASKAALKTKLESKQRLISNRQEEKKSRFLTADHEESEITTQISSQTTKMTGSDSKIDDNEQDLLLDVDNYIPLSDHSTGTRQRPIKSRLDVEIHRSTVQPYQRYSSATARDTAITCLKEAAYFKRKSWLKQVEISKEMVRHKVKRRIRRANETLFSHIDEDDDNEITNQPSGTSGAKTTSIAASSNAKMNSLFGNKFLPIATSRQFAVKIA
ncbi:unnamed protein product [Didymodactylos carnosus]|uniref:Ubiquitin-like domain-containing protein n=1 Tax=Didymodactylos carnosus TaxID=1234261 RepID=A0A814BL44_9BILA|nr:unnamed protein product [Didymodactylos carnosus]CAF0930026.1 unnamed protein product [Didymodactylos carnosus]CAF3533529.1 unnamed protein product [Didymodactylos carnosus]CAF3708099.1 unnamed protein product [Didymodactylos carnosus]